MSSPSSSAPKLVATVYNIDGEWCVLSARKGLLGVAVDFVACNLAQHTRTPVLCSLDNVLVFYHPATNYVCPLSSYKRVTWKMDGIRGTHDLPTLRAKYPAIDLDL